jgi:hypothetical protein
MKTRFIILSLLLVSLGPFHAARAAVVSFDDIPVGNDWARVQNGYGGLDWIAFGSINGLARPNMGAFTTGTVSASNVAFNIGGSPAAAIRSSVPFNLESAHLTGGIDLQIQVQGWVGTRLAYNNTYKLNPAGPKFVEFNYAGVDKVTFVTTPETIFVMDDVAVSPGEPSSCSFQLSPGSFAHGPGAETNTVSVATQDGCAWAAHNTIPWVIIMSSVNNSNAGTLTYRVAINPRAESRSGTINIAGHSFTVSQAAGQVLTAPRPLHLGTVVVPTIGRVFQDPGSDPSFPLQPQVISFLIDQSQRSGGGAVLPNITANWDTNIQFTLTVAAPPDQRFRVQVPPGQTAQFAGFMEWQAFARGGLSPVGPVSVGFEELEGRPPDFTGSDAVLADMQGFVGFSEITSGAFTQDLVFSSVTFTGTVARTHTGFETLDYVPHGECFLFIFSRSSTPDGGATVSIVPNSRPRIDIVDIFPDAGTLLMVQGLAGRTHIVEVSPDLIHWDSFSTFVMPAGVCPTCRPFFLVQDDTRPRPGLRFYRALRVPEVQP